MAAAAAYTNIRATAFRHFRIMFPLSGESQKQNMHLVLRQTSKLRGAPARETRCEGSCQRPGECASDSLVKSTLIIGEVPACQHSTGIVT